MVEMQIPTKICLFRKNCGISFASLLMLAAFLTSGTCEAASESLVDRYSKYDDASGLTARGIVVANAEVTFSTALVAPISEMPLKAGAPFAKGDRLVRFDCGRTRAELRGAEATQGKQKLILENRQKLKQRNAATTFEVLDAKADYDVARAQTEAIKETEKFCEIGAPFNGRVLELHANTHEMPGSNIPLLTVIDDSSLELDLIVPSKWLQWISVGDKFDFSVEETGKMHAAVISRLGAKVDAVSQTIKIAGSFVDRPVDVLPGMSGSARFDPPTQ